MTGGDKLDLFSKLIKSSSKRVFLDEYERLTLTWAFDKKPEFRFEV